MDDFYNEYFDEAYDDLENLCQNEKEKDAATDCLVYIIEHKQEYDFALSSSPKYKNRRKKDFDKAIAKAKSQQDIEDIILEYRSIEPLQSDVKYVKNDIWEWCDMLLQKSGISKKRRLEDFRPLIYKILTSPKCLKSKYEEEKDAENLTRTKSILQQLNN